MEFIFEILFNCFGELLLQFFGEILVDYGLRSLVDGDTARRHPILSFVGNVLLGLIAGGLSLLLFQNHLIKAIWLRATMLLITPALAGFAMSAIGKWQEKKGGERSSLERFWNGFVFALVMVLVRYFWAK